MNIDDKMTHNEINRYLPKSTPSTTEKIEEKQPPVQPKVEGEVRSEQDTIVNLSRASKEAQQIKEIISAEPAVREDKVSALKERIESGKYIIDHDGVADKLVDASVDEIL